MPNAVSNNNRRVSGVAQKNTNKIPANQVPNGLTINGDLQCLFTPANHDRSMAKKAMPCSKTNADPSPISSKKQSRPGQLTRNQVPKGSTTAFVPLTKQYHKQDFDLSEANKEGDSVANISQVSAHHVTQDFSRYRDSFPRFKDQAPHQMNAVQTAHILKRNDMLAQRQASNQVSNHNQQGLDDSLFSSQRLYNPGQEMTPTKKESLSSSFLGDKAPNQQSNFMAEQAAKFQVQFNS